MNCLDTYALIEIAKGSPAYQKFFEEEFVVPDTTLAELYWVLFRDYGQELAEEWYQKLMPYSKPAEKEILIAAMDYRKEHRKQRVSFFDSVGYVFAITRGYPFVTGDKEFKGKHNVVFVK